MKILVRIDSNLVINVFFIINKKNNKNTLNSYTIDLDPKDSNYLTESSWYVCLMSGHCNLKSYWNALMSYIYNYRVVLYISTRLVWTDIVCDETGKHRYYWSSHVVCNIRPPLVIVSLAFWKGELVLCVIYIHSCPLRFDRIHVRLKLVYLLKTSTIALDRSRRRFTYISCNKGSYLHIILV